MSCCDSTRPLPSGSGSVSGVTRCPTHVTASRLVQLCCAGEFAQAEAELYADAIESIEPFEMVPGQGKVTKGKAAVQARSAEWEKNTTVHSCEVEGPFPQPDTGRFAVVFKLDCTCAQTGRMQMNEVALYTCDLKTGKITRAEFFYARPGGGECGKDDSACADSKPAGKTGCCGGH